MGGDYFSTQILFNSFILMVSKKVKMIKRHHPLYLETINLLTNGAFSRTSEFHQFVFSSLNVDQVQSRYVVLRNFIEEDHNLIFFTDKRSPKVNAILRNSETECLFYDKLKKIQLRIKTKSHILHDKKKIIKYWNKVPLVSRQSYSTKLPPSTVLEDGQIDPNNWLNLHEDNKEKSFYNFCVIENYIKEIDFLSLTSSPHKRIRITINNRKIIIQDLIP